MQLQRTVYIKIFVTKPKKSKITMYTRHQSRLNRLMKATVI